VEKTNEKITLTARRPPVKWRLTQSNTNPKLKS
jgi:hypothetical protein